MPSIADAIRGTPFEGMTTEELIELVSRGPQTTASVYRPAPFTRFMQGVQDTTARGLEAAGLTPQGAREMGRTVRGVVDFGTGLDSGTRAIQALQAQGVKPDLDTAFNLLDASVLAAPAAGFAVKPAVRAAKRMLPKGRAKAPRLSPTFEVKPGANTGQPDPLDPRRGRWDRRTLTGARKDALYDAAGYRQKPTRQGTGAYRNSLGEMEHNDVFVGDVIMPGGLSDPDNRNTVEALEGLRALIDANEAGAAHTRGEAGPANAILMERARLPNRDEMAALSDMGDLPYMTTTTSRGALAFPYDTGDTSRLDDVADKLATELGLPGSRQRRVSTQTAYVPGLAKGFDDDYNIVASEPFSGQATIGALERLAKVDDDITSRLAGDRTVRSIIEEKIARDADLPGARQDLQETRRLFADPRWNEALQLIRLGASPAAALAAIGYSTSALAEER